MQYVSHVFHFPSASPFDVEELRWPSFVGEFIKPIVTATPNLTYWFTYYGDHAKFRVYVENYELIRGLIEAERDRLGLTDSGGEKNLTLVGDLGHGRFIGEVTNSDPVSRATFILRALCANANLVVDSVIRRTDDYWQFEENQDLNQNPDGSHLFSVNHLYHNMSASQAIAYLFQHEGKPQVLSYYTFHTLAALGKIDSKDAQGFRFPM